MPTYVKIHRTIIAILALLQSLSASTKLSVVSNTGSVTALNATRRFFTNSTANNNISFSPSPVPTPANHTKSHKMYTRRRSKFYSDSSREYHMPDQGYNWQQQQQAYNPWPEYNYQNYHQVTSLPDLTTIVYPRVTTPQPIRHNYNAIGPPITKLYTKPYHHSVLYPADLEDEEDEHLPFNPWYSGYRLYRRPPSIPSIPSVHLTPVTYHSQGHSFGDDRISSIEHYHAAIGHHVPVIYHHHHEESGHLSKLNLKHIGIMALIKLGLTKLKIFAILKLLFLILLKFKLLLLIMFIKFFLFLKAIKQLKALLIPLLLLLGLLLLPLLLLPLLLPFLLPMFALRYLLPLLLLLPLPGSTGKRQHKADSRLMEYLKSQQSDPLMDIMRKLMDAEICVQRIACQLATRKESRLLYPIIKWYLNKMVKILKHGRVLSYVEAYMKSSEVYENSEHLESIDGRQWCQQRYSCTNSDSPSKNNTNNQNSLNVTSATDSQE